MFDVNKWVEELTEKIKTKFRERILFIGFQGSYARNEANENSDVDIVVIIDKLSINDLKTYKNIINSMAHKEKACGFISGKDEIKNWSKIDIFQFKNDTKAILGSLEKLLPDISRKDIKTSLKKLSADLYHMAVHNYLYENEDTILKNIIKSLFFLFLGIYYLRTDIYVSTKKELSTLLTPDEKFLMSANIENMNPEEKDIFYNRLIKYLSAQIQNL